MAFIQYQEKAMGFARFVYVQGGPLLTGKGEKHAEAIVALFLDHLALGRFDLLAIDFAQCESSVAVLALLARGFTPVVSARNHTLVVDLTEGPEPILQAMERRWRRALQRAEQHETLSVRFVTNIDERLACFDAFSTMYRDLKSRKGFDSGLNCEAYRDLAVGDSHHLFLEVRDGVRV